jgi:hypothetical protein
MGEMVGVGKEWKEGKKERTYTSFVNSASETGTDRPDAVDFGTLHLAEDFPLLADADVGTF